MNLATVYFTKNGIDTEYNLPFFSVVAWLYIPEKTL